MMKERGWRKKQLVFYITKDIDIYIEIPNIFNVYLDSKYLKKKILHFRICQNLITQKIWLIYLIGINTNEKNERICQKEYWN